MKVKLADKRGFCFGVEYAIEIAERAIEKYGRNKVVALGPVIHNKSVVEHLEQKGLDQSGDLETIPKGSNVLIRSHGATPETIARARRRNLNIVDATCVLVKKAQNMVRKLHEEGYQVVMIGDRNHPEVRGVIGYAPNVVVIDSLEEVAVALPRKTRLGIVAQTTHSPAHLAEIVAEIVRRPFKEIKIHNTLCMEVTQRQAAAVALCSEVDVMFVLGGLHSANTQELTRLCQAEGAHTYHLEKWEDFDPAMVAEAKVAGVTAGASTPEWTIQAFVRGLEAL
ncbi:MAG: 4-hydroxy-3-methylbut-2-enyl diphosphate reductase [Phycisphaerae bacterium]|nr:4-hydroxy-3-methylbut-2-enyl diphosphate reductase [Phycisphaerae bacterium]